MERDIDDLCCFSNKYMEKYWAEKGIYKTRNREMKLRYLKISFKP